MNYDKFSCVRMKRTKTTGLDTRKYVCQIFTFDVCWIHVNKVVSKTGLVPEKSDSIKAEKLNILIRNVKLRWKKDMTGVF